MCYMYVRYEPMNLYVLSSGYEQFLSFASRMHQRREWMKVYVLINFIIIITIVFIQLSYKAAAAEKRGERKSESSI